MMATQPSIVGARTPLAIATANGAPRGVYMTSQPTMPLSARPEPM
jgi:hypothetical protein